MTAFVALTAKGVDDVAELFDKFPRRVKKKLKRSERHHAEMLRALLAGIAPIDTGLYRAMMMRQGSVVFNPLPYAMRLEHGFNGRDSLGRSYSQEAQPHWRPATDIVAEAFAGDVRKIVKNGLKGRR